MMTTEQSAGEKAMSEEQMVHLVRNALLVAGQEMGDGDQWPVVKDTIYKVMKDYEDLKIERNVSETMKPHMYEHIAMMEAGLPGCSPEARAALEPKIKELREVCDAYFAEIDEKNIHTDTTNEPQHIQRMRAIISSLEDDNV